MSILKLKEEETNPLFFLPNESAANLVKYATRAIEDANSPVPYSVRWGVPSLDQALLPLRMGKIMFIVARPGNGKSSTAVYLARHKAEELARRGEQNSVVVYISLDQPVEEIEAIVQAEEGFSVTDIAWGRVDLDGMKRKAIKRVDLPLIIGGKSVESEKKQPRLTYTNIYAGLKELKQKHGLKIALVVLDYMQAFRLGGKNDRTSEVTEATFQARELCLDEKIPLVACVQAGRETDKRELNLPTLSDCQHASAIEQEGDVIVSVARPVLYRPEGSTIKARVRDRLMELAVTQQLFIMQVLKQRMSPAGQLFYLYFDPSLCKLADLEI